MNGKMTEPLRQLRNEMAQVLRDKMIPFWLNRSIDTEWGGYLTSIDEKGIVSPDEPKFIVTQARMLWGFSALRKYVDPKDAARIENAARQGYQFLIKNFWDKEFGGFFWSTTKAGVCTDPGKLSYAQSFAIYALSEYALQFGDPEAREYAEKTFNAMQIYAADTLYGGYYENMQMDWSLAGNGMYAGDRKSLDIHMHLMESFTTLYKATQKEIHRRKLIEVINLILLRMADREKGYGFNQFDISFKKIPAINIYRTWNAERETNERIDEPKDTTSYGHNVELSWLLAVAYDALGTNPGKDSEIMSRFLDHSIKYGYDNEYGGIYRDGIADSPALVTDKEWWQNFEAMTGYLNGYFRFGKEDYLKHCENTWEFIKKHFLIEPFGESRQLLARKGESIIPTIGNPWKGIYHTGRALAECISIAEKIENGGKTW
ncbi:putative N-acyl-D-glucosamine 2-epimerase [Leadbettera azotonutricia ZAS-9]|uniref:Putative N-acyl-D-glucosamine 2-epimerase n=2 Tax=Leadbettera azotonutricia TaxID=150829 RepID=F5YF18_LEAAZ|nr:putative N-acyl-D-glucosamine 2-epimerase [Leadbettera azotonutricia ZAS-9]